MNDMIQCRGECGEKKHYSKFYVSSKSVCAACITAKNNRRYYAKRAAMMAAEGREYVPGSYQKLGKFIKEKDMDTHDLIWVRKNDQKVFHVRRIDNSSYSVKDPMTGEKDIVSSHFMRKQYDCVSKFSKNAKKKMLDFSFLQTQQKQMA